MSNSSYWETRVNNIRDNVSLRSLVDYFNVPCQSLGEVTQLHCPFHGNDNHASARIYETNTMYCWVCAKRWDVISFIQDYKGVDFRTACSILEDMYNLEKPDKSIAYFEESFKDFLKKSEPKKEKDFDKEFKKINNILIKNRDSYSLKEYINYFYYLDTLYMSYQENKHTSDKILEDSLHNLVLEIS